MLFDSNKAKLVHAKINKIIKKRISDPSNSTRQSLLSELKLSILKRYDNKRLSNDLISIIELAVEETAYKTIPVQKSKQERKKYTSLYSEFIISLGTETPIIIDRCDSIKFSNEIINATKMANVSWNDSNSHIGIQLADMLLVKKP